MATKQASEVGSAGKVKEQFDTATQSLAERGRSVADQIPSIVEGAGGVIQAASSQLEDLSDNGVIVALGVASGVVVGLFLSGAPRPILALALVPVAITARAAMKRGVRVSRLLN